MSAPRRPDRRGGRLRRRLWSPGSRQAAQWEIEHHIEERAERLIAQGWDPDEAHREAARMFGDVVHIRRELTGIARAREGRMRMGGWMDGLRQDVRLAFRNLRRRPGFTFTLVVTLSLGIGANAAIFAVLDALLTRPLPFRHAERIVDVGLRLDGGFTLPWVNPDQVEPLLESAEYFEATALHARTGAVRTDGREPENVRVLAASHELDDFLGAPLEAGRSFTSDDAVPGAPKVVIFTPEYWRAHGADPEAVGRDIRLDGELYTVVGILGAGFKFPVPSSFDLWVPLATDRTALGRPVSRVELHGRLRADLTLEAAQARADAVSEGLDESTPHRMGWRVRLSSIDRWRANPDVKTASLMITGAVGLILLIALVNGVNLMLVRGASRAREMGVRAAIGASRARLVRQILTESAVMASIAGIVAVGFALAGTAAAEALLPYEIRWSSFHDFRVEERTLGFTFGVAWLVGLLLGLLPAAQAARHGRLRGGVSPAGHRGRRSANRLEHGLVAVEVALSVALLAGAGLLANSFVRLVSTDPGFDPERLLIMEVSLSEARYTTPTERALFFNRLTERLAALPGVEAASRADAAPPRAGFAFDVSLRPEGGTPPPGQPRLLPMVSADGAYLDVLGTELIAGRNLTPDDFEVDNVLIDQPLATFLWPGENALGRSFRTKDGGPLYTVVGVTENVRLMGVDDRDGAFDVFTAAPRAEAGSFGSIAIRTAGRPEAAIPDVRRALQEIDPEQAIRDIQTGTQAMADDFEKPRFLVSVMGLVAGLAAVLSMVGIFGVTAYVVGQRRREFGIRIALGAPLGRVRAEVRLRAMRWAGLGVAVGLAIAIALDGAAAELLYRVEPGDPLTYAAVALAMLVAALVGCDAPARQATRTEPTEVLRTE